MEELTNIVRVRRLTLAGHILRLPPDRPAKCGSAVCTRWRQEKKRTSKKDLASRETFRKDLQEI